MSRESAFEIEGRVVAVLSARTCRVELANGHQLVGFVAGRAGLEGPGPRVGETVNLRLSPYDLSEGRIMLEKHKI